jgi:hypothetical protein
VAVPNLKLNSKKQLSRYSKRLLRNPWEPSLDICLDTLDAQKEQQVLQERTYDTVITYHMKQPLTTNQKLYTFVVLLISLSRQRLYEINPNSRAEDRMLISITPSNTEDQTRNDYEIQWSLGQ